MKRMLTILIATACLAVSQRIQAQVTTTLRIDKQDRTALSISLPENKTLVKEFVEYMIKKSDGKLRHSSGFIVGRNIDPKDVHIAKGTDAYFDIEETKNGSTPVSVVKLALKNDDGTFAGDSTFTALNNSVAHWLGTFQTKLEIYKRDKEIASLTHQLKTLTKELSKLRSEASSNKSDNMKAIKENEKAIADIQAKLESIQHN